MKETSELIYPLIPSVLLTLGGSMLITLVVLYLLWVFTEKPREVNEL